MPNIIRLGDPISHGGKVISAGASYYLVDGIAVVINTGKSNCGHFIGSVDMVSPLRKRQISTLHTDTTAPLPTIHMSLNGKYPKRMHPSPLAAALR